MTEKTPPFPYADILNCARPTFPHRKKMSPRERAAQFSPFSALRGYEEEIGEVTRATELRRELSEEECEALNAKLLYLSEIIQSRPEVVLTYYVSDSKKAGGHYVREIVCLRLVNFAERTVTLQNHALLSFDDIFEIEGDVFAGMKEEREA